MSLCKPILIKLSDKARHALQEASASAADTGMLWEVTPNGKDLDDELSIFAGHTRFVSAKKPPRQSYNNHSPERQQQNMNSGMAGGSYAQLPNLTAPVQWARPPQPPPQLDYSYHPSSHSSHPHANHARSSHLHQSYVRAQPPPPQYGYAPQPHPQAPHHMYPPPGYPALADLGLSSRDSRLDERWSSFMHDSGLLDDVGIPGGYQRR